MPRRSIICILICLLLFLGMLYFISSRTKPIATADSNKISSSLTEEVETPPVANKNEESKVAQEAIKSDSGQIENSVEENPPQTAQSQEETKDKSAALEDTNKQAVEELKKESESIKTDDTPQEQTTNTKEGDSVADEAKVSNDKEGISTQETPKEEESVKEEPAKEEEATKSEPAKEETPQAQTEEKAPQAENSQKSKEIELEIKDILKLNKVEFETASTVITPNGEAIIVKIAEVLKKYPNIKVEIAGYTDSTGNKEFNQKLSQQRADSVKEELIKQNIDSSRLTAKGYGDSKPLVTKADSQDIQENRRVEFHIIAE